MRELIGFDYTLLIRLIAAVVCGGLIGWERGGTKHEAGLRTHIIVCLGAATVMVVSECLVASYNIGSEVMRMSSQIISGIGFLGAGSIIVDGNRIRGITTAAGIWTTACIGIAVGAGYYLLAFFVVALMLFTMLGLRSVTKKLRKKDVSYTLAIEISGKNEIKNVLGILSGTEAELKNIKTDILGDKINVVIDVILPEHTDIRTVIGLLASDAEISEVTVL